MLCSCTQTNAVFRLVPGHGQGNQTGLNVTGAPEGGKKAGERKKMEDDDRSIFIPSLSFAAS